MNSTQLHCFLAVTDHLNFARASEELHISQPAVTHQINSLENELGVKLFKRTTRQVSLTNEGFFFLPDARKILNDMHLAQIKLSHQNDSKPRTLNIGCHNALELSFLPAILKKLKNQDPLFHPDIKTLPFKALNNLLQNEAIDVMFDYKEERRKTVPGQFQELQKAPIVCALPKDHPLSHRTLVTEKDLRTEQMTVLEPPKIHPQVFTVQSQLLQNLHPSDMYFCESYHSALTLTKAGMGISILPDIIPMRDPLLSYVPLAGTQPLSYGLYYKTKKDRPLLKEFLTATVDFFKLQCSLIES